MIRVLVVEDDEDLRFLLRLELEGDGRFAVSGAPDAETAFGLLGDVDVVLMDLRLPGMHGLDAVRAMDVGHPPVIAMSAHGGATASDDARDAGCVAYVAKPHDLDELIELIEGTAGLVDC